MSARARMVMRANVERNLTPGYDAYGNAQAPTWGQHLPAQPCYWYQPAGRGEIIGKLNVNTYTTQMLVPRGTDINEQDRINGVKDRDSGCITDGVYGVVAIVHKPDHLLITLNEVT